MEKYLKYIKRLLFAYFDRFLFLNRESFRTEIPFVFLFSQQKTENEFYFSNRKLAPFRKSTVCGKFFLNEKHSKQREK